MIRVEEEDEEEGIPPVNPPFPYVMRPFPYSLVVEDPLPPLKSEVYQGD